MPDDLDYAREVTEAATPGPWEVHHGHEPWERSVAEPTGNELLYMGNEHGNEDEDARAIALWGSTHAAALAVVDAAERARQYLADVGVCPECYGGASHASDCYTAETLAALATYHETLRAHRERSGEHAPAGETERGRG